MVGVGCGIGIRRQGSRYDSRRQASRCDARRQASRCDCRRHKIGSCSRRHMYKMGRWETVDSHVRPETGFQGEATGHKSLDRELRETGVRTGASLTGRTRHECPGHLTLSRQNIFFPDDCDNLSSQTMAHHHNINPRTASKASIQSLKKKSSRHWKASCQTRHQEMTLISKKISLHCDLAGAATAYCKTLPHWRIARIALPYLPFPNTLAL